MKKYFIIGGTYKSGTSSLFTYLNQLEQITGSKIKETGFFIPSKYSDDLRSLKDYESYFNNSNLYCMEASPGYLSGGDKIAKSIKDKLGNDVKILFILRNPTERFISFYKMLINGYIEEKKTDVINRETTFVEFFQKSKIYYKRKELLDPDSDYVLSGLKDGCYEKYLLEWYKVFDKENIRICFFDDLADDPKKMCEKILDWLEISTFNLDKIDYRVVNKSRSHRFEFFKNPAIYLNRKFEHYFRNNPKLKNVLVKIYWIININEKEYNIDDKTVNKINKFYKDKNRKLYYLLKKLGYSEVPDWVNKN